MEEHLGAFVGGGSGGEDVIEQDDGLVADRAFEAGHGFEGSAEVFQPFGPAEAGLCLGIAVSFECVDRGDVGELGEALGNFLGLVEFSLSHAEPVERDGNEDSVFPVGVEPGVVECDRGESGQFSGEVDLASVFEIVNELTACAIAMEGGSGEIEGQVEVAAIGADEL